jgi:hypothetical protein
MMTGYETGLRSQFNSLRRRGVKKQTIMEVVMLAQMYAGMRGLGHVYRAVGDILPAFTSPDRPEPWPDNWGADPAAFRCGLDLTSRDMSAADITNLTDWYDRTIGYVPDSVAFGLKYSPKFIKLNRARWERTLKTAPKQLAPFQMLRHNMVTNSVAGLRESALLAKAWGITRQQVAFSVTNTAMYYTHFEGLYAVDKALEPIFENWD